LAIESAQAGSSACAGRLCRCLLAVRRARWPSSALRAAACL